jgi:hypothetical protein
MVEKPTSGDEEQRRAQTRAARKQSGLPPETDDGASQDGGAGAHERDGERDGERADRRDGSDTGAQSTPEQDR